MLEHILQELSDGPADPHEPCPDPRLLEGAIRVIMKGEALPSQIAALLMGLRCRGERAEHLKVVVDVMLENAVPFPGREARTMLFDTCGPGGVGRSIVNISTATALLCAAHGVPVAKHGNRSISSRAGSADTLEAMGMKLDCSPEASARSLAAHNFCFLFAPMYHPSMRHAGTTRKEIKFRSIFNLAGPLSNPALPTHQLVGVGKRELMEPIVKTLKLLGRRRALVVHGRNGMDEISLSQVTEALHLREDGKIETLVIEPRDFGVELTELTDLVIVSPADSAARIRRVLEGEPGPLADEINANVAAILWLADRASSFGHGFMMAREVQQSGHGAALLENVARASQGG